MSDDLRSILQQAAPTPKHRFTIEDAIKRGRTLAWQRRAGITMAVIAMSSSAWAIAATLTTFGPDNRSTPADHGRGVVQDQSIESSCTNRENIQRFEGGFGTQVIRASSPVVEILSGEPGGLPWSLCAYSATVATNADPPTKSLCYEFKFGPGLSTGYTCEAIGARIPNGSDYFLRSSGDQTMEQGHAFLGAVSHRVSRVLLTLDGGRQIEATIADPPAVLGVEYRFFVGFAPPNVDVTVSVEDAIGRELEKERFNAFPVFVVTKSGTGQGAVTGLSTDSIRAWKRGLAPHYPTNKYIDCGDRCLTALSNGSRLTLFASPDQGSAFVGWSGDCSGSQPRCIVRVGRDDEAIAVFADS
jgi:hypothetical protein